MPGRQALLHPALKGCGIDVAPDKHHAALGGGACIGLKARAAAAKLKHKPAGRPIKPDDPLGSEDRLGKSLVQPRLKSRGGNRFVNADRMGGETIGENVIVSMGAVSVALVCDRWFLGHGQNRSRRRAAKHRANLPRTWFYHRDTPFE